MNPQGISQPLQDADGRVVYLALDLAEIGPIDLGSQCQIFLGQTFWDAQATEIEGEELGGFHEATEREPGAKDHGLKTHGSKAHVFYGAGQAQRLTSGQSNSTTNRYPRESFDVFKKIALALSLGLTLGACDKLPKCDSSDIITMVRQYFYDWETKRVRPIGGKEPTEEDLRFDFFGGQRMLKVERDRHKTTTVKDMQIYDIVETSSEKNLRTCRAKARSTPQSRVAMVEFALQPIPGDIEMTIRVW